jgi:hypothetical protein
MDDNQTKSQEVVRQHYVPQFYLRRFTNDQNELEVFDAPARAIGKPIGPKGVAYENYFYGVETGKPDEISQEVEKYFGEIEDLIGKNFDRLVEVVMGQGALDPGDKWLVSLLMSMLWIRGPAMRQTMNRMGEDLVKQVSTRIFGDSRMDRQFDKFDKASGETTPKEMREAVKQMVLEGKYNVEFTNAHHLALLGSVENFANLFFGQNWLVFISRCEKKFITTDNPVAIIVPKREGFWGPTFLERTHIFALARHPHHCPGLGRVRGEIAARTVGANCSPFSSFWGQPSGEAHSAREGRIEWAPRAQAQEPIGSRTGSAPARTACGPVTDCARVAASTAACPAGRAEKARARRPATGNHQ